MDILVIFEDSSKEWRPATCPSLAVGSATDWHPTEFTVVYAVPARPQSGVSFVRPGERYGTHALQVWREGDAMVWCITGQDPSTKALTGKWRRCRVEAWWEQIARLTREKAMLCAEINAVKAAIKAAGAPTRHDGDDRRLTSAEQVTAVAARAEAASRSARAWKKAARRLRWWAHDEAQGVAHLRRGAKAMLAVFSDERTDVKPSSIAASLVVWAEYVRDTIVRADAAEKRLADLRAWVKEEARRWREGAEGGGIDLDSVRRWAGYADVYEKVSRRIDDKEAPNAAPHPDPRPRPSQHDRQRRG